MKKQEAARKSLITIIFILSSLFLGQVSLPAQDKILQWSERFIKEGLKGRSPLDRSRILKGLMYSAEYSSAQNQRLGVWTDFVKENLKPLVQDLSPSKDEGALEAVANLLEISNVYPVPGLEDKLEEWKKWMLAPRFIGPENDIGRLGLSLILLHAKPDAAAKKSAETMLEAVLDFSRYENEMHRFGIGPAGQALAHKLLSWVLKAPESSVHRRRLAWMLVTNYKYITRKMAEAGLDEYRLEDAFLEHGILTHGRKLGEKLIGQDPAPADLPHGFSVVAKYASENRKDSAWLSRAKARKTPRFALSPDEWKKMIARNKTEAYRDELRKALSRAEETAAMDIPVYYEPAPNLDQRGKTNELANGVGRKMSPLRAAYLATGDEKWGKAFKDIVMSQVKQFEDYGDFRCYYNLNVPGSWDGLGAVVSYSNAYDILSPKALLAEEEKDRIIRMVREIGHELEWTITYSTFIVHNAWARWAGSMGFLVNYWTDMPEAGEWKELVEARLPMLYSGIDKDGGWYEKTINYHLFTLDLLRTWFTAAKELNGQDLFAKEVNGRRLEMMLDWLVKITPPTGEIPLLNDGAKMNLRNESTAVAMAKTLGRGDFFKAINDLPEKPAVTEPDLPMIQFQTPDFTSVLLEESGYGVFRSGWDPDDLYFNIKFGEHGGGHGHYDKGSIYLHAFGRPWLIDPGYGQKETHKHNTVLVDGKDQLPATGKLLNWHEGKDLNLASVGHRAYPDVDHRRTVLYMKPGTILVVDKLTPLDGQAHTYDWLLQFNSASGRSSKESWTSEAQGSGVKVTFPQNDGAGKRAFAAAVNVNELPSNYQRMGNDNLYLQIWRGKWSKKAEKPVIFAALIEAYQGKEPGKSLSQKQTKDGLVIGIGDAGSKSFFELKGDGSYLFTGPDGRKTAIKQPSGR